MRKLTKFFIGLISLLIVTLSCEQDNLLLEEAIGRSIQLTPIDKIRNGFNLENFDDPAGIIKDNIQIQWENHNTKTIDETLWYEFSAVQEQKADMVSEFQGDNQYKLLASVDENRTPHYFIVKLAPQKGAPLQQFSYLDPQHFTGTVSLYNLQGEVVFLEYYQA